MRLCYCGLLLIFVAGLTTASATSVDSRMADANATITLNATNIRLATFAYGNAEAVNKPTNHLGIASIPYEAVQRINPTWITFILCGALVSGSTWQQRLAKERRAKKNRA